MSGVRMRPLAELTLTERLDVAASLLLLDGSLALLEALHSAGLHVILDADRDVLTECRGVRISAAAGSGEPAFVESTRGIARAEHARRERARRFPERKGGA